MNWKLILQLSFFGLAMGLATVFFIPSAIEPFFWLAIFVVSAWVIARQTEARRFAHGMILGFANCSWLVVCHAILWTSYSATHAAEMQMMRAAGEPPMLMLLTGPLIGLISGVLIGLLAVLAGYLAHAAAKAPARSAAFGQAN